MNRIAHDDLDHLDGLTPAQLAELHADLKALRVSLTRTLGQSEESAAIVDLDAPIGRLSRMDAMQQQQMAKASQRRGLLRLTMVEAALARVVDDTYGDCCQCDDAVGYRRLKTRPETPNCVDCQSTMEKR
ncbi:MAG: DnaK suppressor protein [Myxococcota bacterium]|jgi:DnaK suppressor protein